MYFEGRGGGRKIADTDLGQLSLNLSNTRQKFYRLANLNWSNYFSNFFSKYSHAPHNDVSVNDVPHMRRWSHNIIILYYNTIVVTIAHSIQYSNMLYSFVA